jgi:hypothetical protein
LHEIAWLQRRGASLIPVTGHFETFYIGMRAIRTAFALWFLACTTLFGGTSTLQRQFGLEKKDMKKNFE